MRIYRIRHNPKTGIVSCNVKDTILDEEYPLVKCGNHGSEFNYGYPGSGPADLAWSILANYFNESNLTLAEQRSGEYLSVKLHQDFKTFAIEPLDQKINSHEIGSTVIQLWLKEKLPGLSLEDYFVRRGNYRTWRRKCEELEAKFADTEEGYEEEKATWDQADKEVQDYLTWFYALEVVH
jgi:hypothetical protein